MRIALCLQYNGSKFCGWQRQKTCLSVQETLEESIAKLDSLRPIKSFAAGRTDSGVHASGQVVHFDCSATISPEKWAKALNGKLPDSIRVIESIERPASWHACYSAKSRRYRYTIYNGCRPNLFLLPWSWHRYQVRLNEVLMKKALNQLLGEHDFLAFQRTGTNRPTSITTVQKVSLTRNRDLIFIEIQASGFLYGMVRLLVSQLVSVGENRLSLNDFEHRWKNKLRSQIQEAAPPNGLCLLRVGYKERIFSKEASFDTFPKHHLPISDSPKS